MSAFSKSFVVAASVALVVACKGSSDVKTSPPGSGSGARSGSAMGSGSGSAAPASAPVASAPIDAQIKTTNDDGTLASDPALVTGKLPNGLTYYILHNAKPEKRVELWLAVNAGSVLEDDDQRGLAHLIEHMAFNGTKKYAKQEIVGWLEKIGMEFGADVNARTTWDETVFQLQVPSDDPAFVAHGLDVLHEWAQGIAFDPVEVDKERGVVLEERRLGRGAHGRLRDKVITAALPNSKYGVRLPIGSEQIIKTATPQTLKRFYHDWYRPDLMAVIAVGDIDPKALQQQIESQFGDLVAPPHERPRPDVAVPAQAKTVALSLADPELPTTIVAVASKQPHVSVRDEASVRSIFADLLFSAMLHQRLEEVSKHADAAFIGTQVVYTPILRPIDAWVEVGLVKGDHVADTLETVATEVARVVKFGFLDSEVARAKKDLLQQIEVRAKEKDKTESHERVEEIVKLFLTGEVLTSLDQELSLASRLVPGISASELQQVGARAASKDNRVVIAAGNTNVKLPDANRLIVALAAGEGKATTAWVDDVAAGPLVATPPTPGTITSESVRKDLGITEWTLSNGIKVVLKPTDFQADYMVVTGWSHGGTSLASDADFVAASNIGDILTASGAGTLSAVQLTKALTGTGVNVWLAISETAEIFVGAGQPEHAEQLLQLMYLRLTTPRSDPAAVEVWRNQEMQKRKNQLADPATVFAAKFRSVEMSNHPRYRLLTSDDFATLDVAHALAFYRERLAHLGGATFVVTGAFAIDKVKPLILTYLGGLPTGSAEQWRDLNVERPTGAIKFEVKQGIEPKASVHLQFHTAVPWTREAAHDLTALAAALAIRLQEDLREGMSGTYGVDVTGTFKREPKPIALLDIQFGCAPENIDALIKAAQAIIATFQTAGPPTEVVDKVKQAERRARETDLKQNGFWINRLLDAYMYGDDPSQILTEDTLIDAVSVARLRDAAKLYLGKDSELGVLRPAK